MEKTKVTSLEKAVEDTESKRKTEVSTLKSHHAAEMKQVQEKIEMAKDYEELCKNVANLKTENRLLRSEVEKNAAAWVEFLLLLLCSVWHCPIHLTIIFSTGNSYLWVVTRGLLGKARFSVDGSKSASVFVGTVYILMLCVSFTITSLSF